MSIQKYKWFIRVCLSARHESHWERSQRRDRQSVRLWYRIDIKQHPMQKNLVCDVSCHETRSFATPYKHLILPHYN